MIKITKQENGGFQFETKNLTPIEIIGLLTHYSNLVELELINSNIKEKIEIKKI